MAGRYEEVLARTPSLGKVPLVAVIKEVAPTKKAATDEILGVAAFQREYFGNRPLYLDEDREFYAFLGNRKLLSPWMLLKPWKIFGVVGWAKNIGSRLKNKKVEGNYAGEGIVQGGVLVMAPGEVQTCLYKYQEVTGSPVPLDDFEAGLAKLAAACK